MIEVKLPFKKVTARAILVRREDGCLFGVLHEINGRYSPPGGAVDQGESPEEALLRELEEEKIRMISPDYLEPLFSDPSGKAAAVAALAGMAVGIVFIKRMIKIKV